MYEIKKVNRENGNIEEIKLVEDISEAESVFLDVVANTISNFYEYKSCDIQLIIEQGSERNSTYEVTLNSLTDKEARSSLLLKAANEIELDELDYEDISENLDLWEVIHAAMEEKDILPPFYKSFDEYSSEWFEQTKEDFITFLRKLAE